MNKVGNLMKQKRESMGLSIDDVVDATKIQKVYIDAIEKGDFSFFKNQDFYQQVFVGSYAEFLKLDKNEVLLGLSEDAKNYVPNSVAKEIENPTQRMPFKPAPSLQPVNKPVVQKEVEPVVQKEVEPVVEESIVPQADFLQDYEVKSDPQLMEEEQNNLSKDMFLQQGNDAEQNDEINQLIDEINHGVEIDFDEYFGESNPKVEEVNVDEMLNSTLLDDIEGINAQVESSLNSDPIATIQPTGNQHFNLAEQPVEKTDVIDLTSGIEIETVNSGLQMDNDNVMDINPQAMPQNPIESMNKPLDGSFDSQLSSLTQQFNDQKPNQSEEDVIAALENTLSTQLNINLNDEEPERTSMDLKVAKALGDSKVAIDKKDAKKMKRDKILDTILIILIVVGIILLGFFGYKLIK
ncbi:MAG: helix-turn-helix transcriptional regulator [Erysipelotrichales bacterium]